MRSRTLRGSGVIATLCAASALAVPADWSVAAEPATCRGESATLVGTPGGTIIGTEQIDVIVTEGASTVRSLGGNDLICITGSTPAEGTFVDAGDGDDDVLTRVTGGTVDDPSDLGRGDDSVTVHGSVGAGAVEGSGGRDELILADRSRLDWVISTRAGTMASHGRTMPMTGMEDFRLERLTWTSLRFTGSTAAERIRFTTKARAGKPLGPVDVSLGGGNDSLQIGPHLSGAYRGGAGRDTLFVRRDPGYHGEVDADLARGRVRIDDTTSARVGSFADLRLRGFALNSVRLGGGGSEVTVYGCRTTVTGGAGDDLIRMPGGSRCDLPADATILTAFGGRGDDKLFGSHGRDRLVGGRGLDEANGSDGRHDFCSAEITSYCERG